MKLQYWVIVIVGAGLIVLGAIAGHAVWPTTTATTVSIDTTSLIRRAVDSTKASMQLVVRDSATYWRHRYITKPGPDGKPETVTVIDSGGYNQASFYEYLYEETRVEVDSLRQIIASHKCETLPAPAGRRVGLALGVGNALTKHSTSFTLGPALAGTKGAIQLSAGYHPWENVDKWRGNLTYIRWFK